MCGSFLNMMFNQFSAVGEVLLLYFLFINELCNLYIYQCLQCFDAVGWAAGRASDL